VRLITPLCRLALAVLCLAVSLPAFGADTITMTIESSKHGQLRNLLVTSVSTGTAVAPSKTGAAQKGKTGQHGTIRISREIDANSPHLRAMMTSNDILKQVAIEYEKVVQGKRQLYLTIKLTNAVVTEIQDRKPGAKSNGGSSKETEVITMAYEKMAETNSASGKTATDSWTQK
jgi:type VI secretion system Hcp family effector